MPYQYLDDIATADIAFEAWEKTGEAMFIAASDAVMNVMVENLAAIENKEERFISLQEETLETLLFQFLQEFVYYKDSEQLLLRAGEVKIGLGAQPPTLTARLYGERLDPLRHRLNVDVKAVTMHRFAVNQTPRGWEATVVLDI